LNGLNLFCNAYLFVVVWLTISHPHPAVFLQVTLLRPPFRPPERCCLRNFRLFVFSQLSRAALRGVAGAHGVTAPTRLLLVSTSAPVQDVTFLQAGLSRHNHFFAAGPPNQTLWRLCLFCCLERCFVVTVSFPSDAKAHAMSHFCSLL